MKPRILIVHNAYQRQGGEDSVVEAEIYLLRSHGHEVESYIRHNNDIGGISKPRVAAETVWSSRTTREMSQLIARTRPDVVHSHNVFPLVSPSVYWAANDAGVPVVQTLHNFRLACLNALYLRDGQVCEDCSDRVPWRGVLRKCYRGSLAASSVVAAMLVVHRSLGSYRNKVARYIALNEFCRRKFVEAGLPADKVAVKPNFVDYSATDDLTSRHGLLFVGRLSIEKGVAVLSQAIRQVSNLPLRVIGEGPEVSALNTATNATVLGAAPAAVVRAEMSKAVALVVPSIWYENFPRTVVEAFASGLPVVASRIGALAELVREGETGLLFEPGNANDLAEKMAWALANPGRMAEMGRKARAQYETEFSADVNYQKLMAIYQEVLHEAKQPATTVRPA